MGRDKYATSSYGISSGGEIKGVVIMENKKHPKLMFVSEDGIKAKLYVDGVEVSGAKDICIYTHYGSAVEHEVRYVTALTKLRDGLIGGGKIDDCICNAENLKTKEIIGWLGGDHEDLGIFEAKQEAEKGLFGDKLHELLKEYSCKKVKITIEVIDN